MRHETEEVLRPVDAPAAVKEDDQRRGVGICFRTVEIERLARQVAIGDIALHRIAVPIGQRVEELGAGGIGNSGKCRDATKDDGENHGTGGDGHEGCSRI